MSMKRLLLFGIVSYLVFLCIYAPAQLLGSLLGQLTGNRLGLAAAQGSLWKGNANLLLNDIDARDPPVDLGKVSWDSQPLQIFSGRFSVSLSWNEGPPFWITLDPSRLHVEHAVFNLNTEFVPLLVPTLKASQLGGQLAIRCQNFSVTRSEILGQIEIDWNQASAPLSTVSPLGSYQVTLEGQGNALDIRVKTQGEGPLILQGNGRWSNSEGVHFVGTAEAKPTSKAQLQELLRVMGNETPAGSGLYQLRF